MSGAAFPCKTCGMSPRNTVHKNPNQFGYHAWVEKPEKEPTEKRFSICGDDSGHDYYIPVGHESDFYEWVEATAEGDETPYDFDSNRIDGRFTFTDPRCD